jgi:hypothetical protein
MFRARRPAKLSQDVVVEVALDGQIACQRSIGRHVGPGPLDMGDDRGQARRRSLAFADLDAGVREGALHDVRATLRETDVTDPAAAAGSKAAGETENRRGRAATR